MNWKIRLIIVFLFWSCQDNKSSLTLIDDGSYLLEVETLQTVIDNPKIKLLDFRALDDYNNGHIPGALHISRGDIEDKSYSYKGMMASKSKMEQLLSGLGIETDDMMVIYDDKGMCESARFWWILQNYGHNRIKILHGGLQDWQAAGGEVSNAITDIVTSSFKFSEGSNHNYHINKEDVLIALNSGAKIIDTRTIDEFNGAQHKKGAKKAGRIPSSIHMDWANCINYNGNKRLKTIDELESIFKTLNIEKTDPIILYCHSGVRSAHTTFVMTQLLGFENVKNYDGSWTEWSHFDDLPFESDHISLIKE